MNPCRWIEGLGDQLVDVGARTFTPGDGYPEYAEALGIATRNGQAKVKAVEARFCSVAG